jgi:uncharacterized protein YbcI
MVLEKISEFLASFLEEQMGGKTSFIKCSVSGNIVTAYACNATAPAERKLTESETGTDRYGYEEYKQKLFKTIKSELKAQLEAILDEKVLDIDTDIGNLGARYLMITLSRDIEGLKPNIANRLSPEGR